METDLIPHVTHVRFYVVFLLLIKAWSQSLSELIPSFYSTFLLSFHKICMIFVLDCYGRIVQPRTQALLFICTRIDGCWKSHFEVLRKFALRVWHLMRKFDTSHLNGFRGLIKRQLDYLFNRFFFNLITKNTSKLRITAPLWRESTSAREIPFTKGQFCEHRFHEMISS